MKCIRILATLYLVTVTTVTIGMLVACNKFETLEYSFDLATPDQISEIPVDSVQKLFNQGVTVKKFDNKLYFIRNTYDHLIKFESDSLIDFGPITIDRDSDKSINDCYNFELTKNSSVAKALLKLHLKSVYNGEISKIVFDPAWLSFSSTGGLHDVNILPSVVVNFPNRLVEDMYIDVNIPWTTNINLIQGDPIIVSIRLKCYISHDKYFSEVINLNIDNHRVN